MLANWMKESENKSLHYYIYVKCHLKKFHVFEMFKSFTQKKKFKNIVKSDFIDTVCSDSQNHFENKLNFGISKN